MKITFKFVCTKYECLEQEQMLTSKKFKAKKNTSYIVLIIFFLNPLSKAFWKSLNTSS